MAPRKALSQPEFVACIATNFAMVAASIDMMLPGLPQIASELSPDDINRAQLIITSFIFGMGAGTLFAGPLSDSFGRKPIIAGGVALYIAGTLMAAQAQTLETLLAARVIQGLGVAGPRIIAVAIVRDLYAGRKMAKIMSYVFMIFTLVPAIAPLIGSFIIAGFGWRAVFYALIIFAFASTTWLMIRQPETLPPDARNRFSVLTIWQASRECFGHASFRWSLVAQAFGYGILFSALSSVQQIFDTTYERATSFPLWFGAIALLGGLSAILNAKLVERLGMRRIVLAGFAAQTILSATVVMIATTTALPFAIYFAWTVSIFFMAGLVMGNLNALAMEPLGNVAGLAASIIGFISTVLSVGLAIPIGLAFDGTALPLAIGVCALSICGAFVMKFRLR